MHTNILVVMTLKFWVCENGETIERRLSESGKK